jgi:ribonuclease Z
LAEEVNVTKMSLSIVFLGTAASIPTSTRALSATAVQRNGELLLFDCGEGTQRQMIQAKIGFNRKTKIFVTHMHGDHVLGLPGLMQTMALLGRDKPLQIYGPTGIRAYIDAMIETVKFGLVFSIEVHEVEEGDVCQEKEYEVQAAWTEHSIPSLAYALIEKPRPGRFHTEKAEALGITQGPLWSKLQQGHGVRLPDGRVVQPEEVLDPPRPGRKLVYTGDTRPSDKIAEFARDADVVIHEATFGEEMAERAKEDQHSTPSEAALVAKKADAKLLVLTHISARYGDTSLLLEQAKNIFPEVRIAKDFEKIEIPLRET